MKKNLILSGAVASVAFCAMEASAQFSYQNGDMLAAFGSASSGYDVIVDLGSIANFQTGLGGASFTYNLNSVLTSVFGSVNSGIYWAAFGVNDQTIPFNGSVTQADANTVWTTFARSNPSVPTHAPFVAGNSAQQQLALGDIQVIGNLTTPGQASPGLIVDLGPGIERVTNNIGGFTSMMISPNSGNLNGDWTYNIMNNGVGVSDLYQSDPGNHLTQHASLLGSFSLDSDGVLTFSPTPEPSTWAMLGSGMSMLTLLSLRRRK